ncbi:Uncharacterised protein [Mycobacteroides abscessus subsp. abscessus]|nr:Uncharacterised protein [Mycobacteroides abscessus subsp. abscessus]
MISQIATRVTLSAAGDTTVHDISTNFFVEWKWEIAIGALVLLCTAGVFRVVKQPVSGTILIVMGFVLCGVFLNAERWVKIFMNSTGDLDKTPEVNDPFKNPKRLGLGPNAALVIAADGSQVIQVYR